MGLCASKEDHDHSAEAEYSDGLDRALRESERQESDVVKLLLLGPGASGKSTIFKQMITIYGKGFGEKDRRRYRPIVYSNIITSMQTLVNNSVRYGKIHPVNEEARDLVMSLGPEALVDEEVAYVIKKLWEDAVIQTTYDHRSRFQLTDSAKYFFERLAAVAEENYLPSIEDVLRARIHTTGIEETLFDVDGVHFKMMDVGGQRSERKKWVHCFENVTAVVFVAAISEYDQVLFEDANTNRMVETLTLFAEVCNSEWFDKTSMILFLNKRDLFAEKIIRVPLKTYFPDFQGTSYDEATEYMKKNFENLNEKPKQIYTHLTCATDTNNIFMVFNFVKEIIISTSIKTSGFTLT